MSEQKNEATPAAPAAKEPKEKKGSLTPILLGVNSIGLIGVLAVVLLRTGGASAKPAAKAEAHKEESAPAEKSEGEKSEKPEGEKAEGGEKGEGHGGAGPTVKLADFVVHLRNPEADRYARISFELEVASEKDKEAIGGFTPQIRDAFIGYLSDRTMEELRGSQGLERSKAELLKRAQEAAKGAHVRGLYVTDFVVQ